MGKNQILMAFDSELSDLYRLVLFGYQLGNYNCYVV